MVNRFQSQGNVTISNSKTNKAENWYAFFWEPVKDSLGQGAKVDAKPEATLYQIKLTTVPFSSRKD